MITVGLDMSLTGTGVCLMDGDNVELQTISTRPNNFKTIYDRIEYICIECLSGIPKEVECICIEAPCVYGKRVCMDLYGLAYDIRRTMHIVGLAFNDVAPSTLKKFVTGSGNAKKDQVTKELFKRWNIDARDDNQADAAGLAMIGKCILGGEGFTKAQQDTVKKVLRGK